MGREGKLGLRSQRLGPLPIINHFFERLGLGALLGRFVPTADRRTRLPYAQGLGVLVRSILVEREPIYRQAETVSTYAPESFGLDGALADHVGDDAIGRALDQLFDADRGTLLTEVVVAASERFAVVLDELHNDTTTIRLTGQYRAARGRSIRGKRAPFITYGHSKDHRPDLKQLLFVLTTARDGGVPVQFRCEAGNQSDARTHEETWEALRRAAGRPDFLYVADSKLCGGEAMDYIDRRHGRFVTVLPRTRLEDREFRQWIQAHEPDWEGVRDRPHPRRRRGPRDRWSVWRASLPSQEGWPVVWLSSTLLALHHGQRRRERLSAAQQELQALAEQLAAHRSRRRSRSDLHKHIDAIVQKYHVERYLAVDLHRTEDHLFRQERRGRPGPKTRYRRVTQAGWRLSWKVDEDKIAYDRKSDGMYPLLTNDRTLSPRQVFEAHKHQPTIEKRFSQLKSVFEIAPVFLKNEGRIEALFFVYFLALLVQSLIERELRRAMRQAQLKELPLYPEERTCRSPTAEQIFRLFSLTQRSILLRDGAESHVFEPELTDLQTQVLTLLGVPLPAYRRH